MLRLALLTCFVSALCACGAAPATSGGEADAGPASDAGSTGGLDAGPPVDAGLPDAGAPVADAGPYFIAAVISFDAGANAGFGQSAMPGIIEGPPRGAGASAGSTDVLSLGTGGVIVVELGEEIVDGPGPDFTVFENAFETGSSIFQEPGAVAVSDDGLQFVEFPCDPDAGVVDTCAGMHPVFSNPSNGIDPRDPSVSGGDPLDLAAIGVARARYVRIRDLGLGRNVAPSAGFDLDAIAVVNGP